MSELKQWVKLWTKALIDPTLDNLTVADFGRWVKLILYIRDHGEDGKLSFQEPARALVSLFQCDTFQCVIEAIKKFPNCNIDIGVTCNVSFTNWTKYQVDTSTLRVRKFRLNETHKRRGEEKRGEEKRITTSPTPSSPLAQEEWPSPSALISLYNKKTPDECPTVKLLTPARVKKAKQYLAIFPEQDFWEKVFENIQGSEFLRGLRPSNGHQGFVASFDWLLTKGKDGTENAAKVAEGRYFQNG